jgi:DNA-binding NtrC family response regulator
MRGMVCCFLVADKSDMSDVIRSSLADLGLAVRQAATAHDLITETRGQRCDVMLLPDNEETGAYLSRMRTVRGGHVPVMVYASQGDVLDISGAIADGASEYLIAPFTPDMLQFKLKQIGVSF